LKDTEVESLREPESNTDGDLAGRFSWIS